MHSPAIVLTTFLPLIAAFGTAQSFEVASVKVPSVISGQPYDINLGTIQHDTVTLRNASLADCIRFAYGLSSDSQLSGPEWIKSKEVRYDIVARTAPNTSRDQALKMMQALLTERFKLAVHRERRILSYYELLTEKSGSKMSQATDAPVSPPAGIKGQLRIVGKMEMSGIVTLLSKYMRAFVIDQTGLQGVYDVKLVWTPDDRPVADDDRGPSVFTALREQLGLKLESRKGPMEVLIVDHAEPTPVED
jgi:uncharacterized protein (TIGR03435 family)